MSNKLRILSDIHGESWPLHEAYQSMDADLLIQLGDFGWHESTSYLKDHPDYNIKFIHGNHEKYSELSNYPQYLGKYGVLDDYPDIFFISGAWSIDKQYQMMHGVWGEEEELSYSELDDAYKMYCDVKPRVVLSHTAPRNVAYKLISPMFGNVYYGNRTEEMLQNMWNEWKPEIWLFAHWHCDYEEIISGTKFVCTDIGKWCDIDA